MHCIQAAYSGRFQYVYVTPEYITTRSIEDLNKLHNACRFCLIALDEAHCISDMGKGFRCSQYSALHRLRASLSPLRSLPWVAVTATATPTIEVRFAHACDAKHLTNDQMRVLSTTNAALDCTAERS